MKIKRSSGLLMHITSLPGHHGIGTLGKEAYDFVDLLKNGGQKYWQTLPVGPVTPNFGYSPYSSPSSFAGNFFFISLEMLQEEEWMRNYILDDLPVEEHNDYVNFERVSSLKLPLLKQVSENFFKYASPSVMKAYEQFCLASQDWLKDYTLFVSLAEYFNNYNWLSWEENIRRRTPNAIAEWSQRLKPEIEFHQFIQFAFYKQWFALKEYANQNGIKIIGDIPIYVNFDGADVWAHPDIFQLDPGTERPTFVAGVPPDYFSATGQRWGNPLYTWWDKKQLKKETTRWWISRFKHQLNLFDITRVDHFRGFESFWAIPASEPTAVNGSWEKGPGITFFNEVKKELHELPLIAEDLGVITPEVEKLRENLELPGMKILQFAFDFDNKNPYLPHNYPNSNCLVYTGTHDNNTTNGWFYEQDIDEETRHYVLDYLGINHRDEFHWQLIRLALSSTATLSIFPVQDILGYAGRFRMNTPGKLNNNWNWKLTDGRLTPEIMHRLRKLSLLYNRA